MSFNPGAFVDNLYYMGVGMLGILIVMGVLIAITSFLNFVSSRFGKKREKDNK